MKKELHESLTTSEPAEPEKSLLSPLFSSACLSAGGALQVSNSNLSTDLRPAGVHVLLTVIFMALPTEIAAETMQGGGGFLER